MSLLIIPEGAMRGIADLSGKMFYWAALGAIQGVQAEWTGEGGNPFPFDPAEGWDSLENQTQLSPEKRRRPVMVATEAKYALAALFGALIHFVESHGKLPPRGVREVLLNSAESEWGGAARFIVQASEAMAHRTQACGMLRDFGTTNRLTQKIHTLVSSSELVTPGAEVLAILYVQFVKSVAWRAANFICETKFTLNLKSLVALFRDFRSFPTVELEEETLDYVRLQVAALTAPSRPDNVASAAHPQVPASRPDNVAGGDPPSGAADPAADPVVADSLPAAADSLPAAADPLPAPLAAGDPSPSAPAGE